MEQNVYFGQLAVDEITGYSLTDGHLCVDFVVNGYGFYGFPAEYLDIRGA